MELIDRYLKAVRSFLPRTQQEDIINELSENLQAQMDDQAAALGRPLTGPEQEAILQQHGHPMLVASRYQAARGSLVFGRQLIGPTLFPWYLKVLWLTLGISLAVHVLVFIALATSGNPVTIDGAGNTIVVQLVEQFIAITGIFIALEHYLPTMAWNAHRPPTAPQLFPKTRQVSRLESSAQIVALGVLIVWLRFVWEHPTLLLGPAADIYHLGPVWYAIALPTIVIFAMNITQAVINLVRPGWTRLRGVTRVAADIGSLGIILYLLHADSWLVLAHTNGDQDALRLINHYISYGLGLAAAITLVIIVIDAWRLRRDWLPNV